MGDRNPLRRHIDLLAIAVVLVGYFVFSGLHNGALARSTAAARTKVLHRVRPVHVDGRAFRWMRLARASLVQTV